MNPWEELAQKRAPNQSGVDLGATVEKFLKNDVRTFAGLKAIFHLADVAPRTHSTGEVSGAINEPKKSTTEALERFSDNEVIERRKGLLSVSWRYLKENPKSLMVRNLRKLWKHPRTHKALMFKILEYDKTMKGK